MKKITKLCLWYWLLTKRILKQKVFLAILLLIPFMAGAIRLMPSHDGGIITVAIARLSEDRFSEETVARLTQKTGVIKYRFFDTEDEAVRAVESGQCDAAWIFRKDAQEQMDKFAAGRSTKGAVTVFERENNVTLSLARERLYIAMYPYISYGTYCDFLTDLSEGEVKESTLIEYYEPNVKTGSLIDYYYVDGTRQATSDLLSAPVRGILAMIIMLAALASCLYACRDEQRGVFEHLRGGARAFVPLYCHVVAMVPTAAASLVALYASGLWTDWRRELFTMGLYILSVAAFCELLRLLCRSEVTLGAVISLLMTAVAVLCPIFLHIDQWHILQYSLPPFYYLNAILHGAFIPKLVLYDAAILTVAAVAVRIRNK